MILVRERRSELLPRSKFMVPISMGLKDVIFLPPPWYVQLSLTFLSRYPGWLYWICRWGLDFQAGRLEFLMDATWFSGGTTEMAQSCQSRLQNQSVSPGKLVQSAWKSSRPTWISRPGLLGYMDFVTGYTVKSCQT